MTLDVHLFPCRSDNYGFLIRDAATGVVAAVDTPDAARILEELEGLGWGRLDLILNTHWHPDHTEGNERLKAEWACEIVGTEEVRKVAPLDRVVADRSRRTTRPVRCRILTSSSSQPSSLPFSSQPSVATPFQSPHAARRRGRELRIIVEQAASLRSGGTSVNIFPVSARAPAPSALRRPSRPGRTRTGR